MTQKRIIEYLHRLYEILDEEACERGMDFLGTFIEKIEGQAS